MLGALGNELFRSTGTICRVTWSRRCLLAARGPDVSLLRQCLLLYTADYGYLAHGGRIVERATGKTVKELTGSTYSGAEAFSRDDKFYIEAQAERIFLRCFDWDVRSTPRSMA